MKASAGPNFNLDIAKISNYAQMGYLSSLKDFRNKADNPTDIGPELPKQAIGK